MKIGKHINLENPTEKLNKSCTSKSYFISKLLPYKIIKNFIQY